MGLAPKSVEKAREILTEIIHMQRNNKLYENDPNYDGPGSSGSLPILEYDKDDHLNKFRTGVIMVAGRKSTPGAWENVFINIENPHQEYFDYFYERKHEVPNSHFIQFKDFEKEGIVCIGFF